MQHKYLICSLKKETNILTELKRQTAAILIKTLCFLDLDMPSKSIKYQHISTPNHHTIIWKIKIYKAISRTQILTVLVIRRLHLLYGLMQNREKDEYFGMAGYISLPTGDYDKNRAINSGLNIYQTALQAGYQTKLSKEYKLDDRFRYYFK
jgi:hypothetical protein